LLDEKTLAADRVPDETVLIAAQGTLGEGEVFCRPILVTGEWVNRYVFSGHFLRAISADPDFPGAYLFAFLRSEVAFRILRSMSAGGKQQDIHPVLRAELPVPVCTASDRGRIAETVRQAYRDRDEADKKEDLAFALLDEAVREAAR
jgi:type I restriction enzyme S subunit